MDTVSAALTAGDQLLSELQTPPARPRAETMGRLQRVSYSHAAMIDLIIKNPYMTQNEIAAHFGYSPAWISNILAAEAFQSAMAARREEVIDPELKATIEERFRALVIKSLAVLQEKLNAPVVNDQVALRCAELGAKALGVGGHASPRPPESSDERLARLAGRLKALRENSGESNGLPTVIDVTPVREQEGSPAGG